jgi:hypothetical protein
LNRMNDLVLQKLSNVMGREAAPTFIAETCRSLGLKDLDAPEARLLFAGALIEKGGLLEAVGRAIKVQALLHGAKERG